MSRESHRPFRSRLQLGLLLLLATGSALGAPVELKFMFWGSGAERDAVENAIKQFNASHPNIHVTAQHVPGDYATKVNTLIAAKQTPDVAYMPEGLALKLGEQGQLLEMSQFFKDQPALKDRLPQTYLYYAPGKTVGTYIAPEITTLFYNRALFQQAGVPVPPATAATAWSWDQFVQTAKKLTLDRSGKNALDPAFDPKNIKQYGVSFPTGFIGWYPFLRAGGADLTDASGKKYTMNTAEAVTVYQRLQDLMYKDHVAPTPTQMQNSPGTSTQLQSRRVAMAIDGQWTLLDIAQAKLDVGVGVLPKMKTSTTVFVGGGSVIFAATQHPKEALELYMYYNDPTKVDLYKKGLWMPLELKYYTDPKFTAQWLQKGVHPPEYQTAVVDYALKNSVVSPTIRYRNWVKLEPVITAGLDPIWTGKMSAKQALDALGPKLQPLLQGLYPTK